MIFTYLIRYEGIDGFGNIEFCAESRNEAIQLFNEWCIIDNKMPEPVPIKFIEKIYNDKDAEEYGSRYGVGC